MDTMANFADPQNRVCSTDPKPYECYTDNRATLHLHGGISPWISDGTPNTSMGMESFNDTPVVNGTVYPTITLEPKPYRFRILSVANDRFFNLS